MLPIGPVNGTAVGGAVRGKNGSLVSFVMKACLEGLKGNRVGTYQRCDD